MYKGEVAVSGDQLDRDHLYVEEIICCNGILRLGHLVQGPCVTTIHAPCTDVGTLKMKEMSWLILKLPPRFQWSPLTWAAGDRTPGRIGRERVGPWTPPHIRLTQK